MGRYLSHETRSLPVLVQTKVWAAWFCREHKVPWRCEALITLSSGGWMV
jgi:hypothetical protein